MKKEQLDGAQALIKTLDDLGIEYIFGYSGGAALPIFDALETVKTNMKFILARHEQGAVHMADGYGRATGKPAAVLVTSGPGAGNTVTGLMTAQMDSVPMVVICGQQVGGRLVSGKWTPDQHWPSVRYVPRTKRAEKRTRPQPAIAKPESVTPA